jgi:hypothetical protein
LTLPRSPGQSFNVGNIGQSTLPSNSGTATEKRQGKQQRETTGREKGTSLILAKLGKGDITDFGKVENG